MNLGDRVHACALALAFGTCLPIGSPAMQAASWKRGDEWTIAEDLRLGSLEGAGPEQFGSIAAITVDAAQRIYILDALAQEVRVFQPDGEFAYTLGGRGEGPGEFRAAMEMAHAPDGRLWVVDPVSTNRYTSFRSDGAFSASFPRRILGYSARGNFLDDGTYVDWSSSFPDEGPGVVAGARVVLHPIHLSDSFDTIDTLPPIEFRQEMIPEFGIPQIFFKARPEVFVSADGTVWFAGTEGYQVFRRSLTSAGASVLAITVDAEPAPVVESDRQLIRANYRGRPDVLSAYLGALPSTKPVIHRIFGDNDGHIYVVPEELGVPVGTVLDVFRESGEYLGRLDLPNPIARVGFGPLGPIHATRDHIYYVVNDELGVSYVSRLSISRR